MNLPDFGSDAEVRAYWEQEAGSVALNPDGDPGRALVKERLLRNLHQMLINHGLTAQPTLAEFAADFRDLYRTSPLFRFFVLMLRLVW